MMGYTVGVPNKDSLQYRLYTALLGYEYGRAYISGRSRSQYQHIDPR